VTPVAITGLGVVSALGLGVDAFWDALVAGRSGCGPARRVDAPGGAPVAEVHGIDARAVARSSIGRRIDPTSLLALAATRLALADAGLDVATLDRARTGLGLASLAGDVTETEAYLERLLARGTGNPLVFPNLVLNAALGYVSIELGLTGPSAMLTEHETSGEAAVAWGARQVASGAVDVCLAGGADELTTLLCRVRAETGTLAGEPPRPLDRAGRGASPGEGAAVLVLEPLARARARGARVYARVAAAPCVGVDAPVHGWPRDAAALARVLAPLVADADVVVAAASGAPALDAVEAEALAVACGARRPPVTAPRGAIGDFGAAGALALAAAARALHEGVVPPTAGCRLPARAALPGVVGAPRRATLRAALVHGLARGGTVRPIRLEAP
jgi:3-oxoacyl-(acyl-carrier-protein) synthase